MFVIHANITIKPDKVEAFLVEAEGLVSASQAEPGCIRYTLMRDLHQAHLFTMVEEWKDEQAVQEHNQSAHFQKFVKDMQEFAAAPLDAKLFNATEVPRG